MADSTSADSVLEERVDNQTDEAILSPQRQNEFQSISPEAQQIPIAQQTHNPLIVIGEGVSTGTLTPDEILAIKQRNPEEALRKLQQLRHLSTDAQPSSSTLVSTSEMDAVTTLKLQ